jgi:hypothetical protein
VLYLIKLYLLGECVCNASFCNAVVDELCRILTIRDVDGQYFLPNEEHIDLIYDETEKESPARRLIVDYLAKPWDLDRLDSKPVHKECGILERFDPCFHPEPDY